MRISLALVEDRAAPLIVLPLARWQEMLPRAEGQPDLTPSTSLSKTHVVLGLELFAYERRTVTDDNWVVVPPNPYDPVKHDTGPEFGDLQMYRVDLAKFPVGGAGGPAEFAPFASAVDDGGSPHALSAPPPPLQHKAGLDYRASDDALAEKIVEGVNDAAGKPMSDWDACGALAPHAAGKGKLESKQKRLSKRVKLLRRQKSCLSSELTE